jgi:rubrerythrin
MRRKPLWLAPHLSIEETRKYAEQMEFEAERFYRKAAESARDASTRKLLMELAEIEAQHEDLAHKLGAQVSKTERVDEEETARRMFVMQ